MDNNEINKLKNEKLKLIKKSFSMLVIVAGTCSKMIKAGSYSERLTAYPRCK